MGMYIIPVLLSLTVLIITLPKRTFQNAWSKLAEYLEVSPVKVTIKERKHGGSVVGRILRLSRQFYYYLPVQMRRVGKARIEKLIRYAGTEKFGIEEITGARYLIVIISLVYTALLYLLSGERLLILFGVVLSAFLFMVPLQYLEIKSQKRMRNIQQSIPSFLTSGAIMLDAGMNIQQMLECISDATVNELSKSIRGALHKTKMGVSLPRALEETLDTCSIEEYRSFITIMVQGLDLGASGISGMVRRLAAESWDARKRLAQNMAQKASMKLFLPLVFLVLPAMLIFLMGPMVFYIGGIFR